MRKRDSKLFWVSRKGEDFLVFDRGHEDGTIYVYKKQESVLVQDIQKKGRTLRTWIEEEYGFPKHEWKIEPI
jgi:hypothetical protein